MNEKAPYREAVRRACLPEILFVPDLALALQLSESGARKALHRGECGRYTRIGRRLAVRRIDFLRAVEATAQPDLRLLGGRRGGGR